MNTGKIYHEKINVFYKNYLDIDYKYTKSDVTRYVLDFAQEITNTLFSHNLIFNGDNYSFFLNSVNGLQQFIRFKNCKSS